MDFNWEFGCQLLESIACMWIILGLPFISHVSFLSLLLTNQTMTFFPWHAFFVQGCSVSLLCLLTLTCFFFFIIFRYARATPNPHELEARKYTSCFL